MKLFEIDNNIQAVIENGFSVNEETGELLFTSDDLSNLKMERNKKVENIALIYLNYKAEAKAITEQIKIFKERAERLEKKAENVSKYLEYATNGMPFESPMCQVSYRRSSRVIVEPGAELPEEYITRKVTETPNKVALKHALDSGEKIKGVSLEPTSTIHIK